MRPLRSHCRTAIQVYEPQPDRRYPIDTVARLTRVGRRTIAVYCTHGLLRPLADPSSSGWFFDDEGIRRLRQLESMRAAFGLNLAALQVTVRLLGEVERLQAEVRFLRSR